MVKLPSKNTVKKYGLTIEEWSEMLEKQGGVCFVCKKIPPSNRLCTDHEHVKNWRKMAPEKRKLYVRGLLCFQCNHFRLGRGITLEKAIHTVTYLEEYLKRRPKD